MSKFSSINISKCTKPQLYTDINYSYYKVVTRWRLGLDSRAQRRRLTNTWKGWTQAAGQLDVVRGGGDCTVHPLHPTWWLHLYPSKSQPACADGAEDGFCWPQSRQLSALHYLPGWGLQSVSTSLTLLCLLTYMVVFLCMHSFTPAYT